MALTAGSYTFTVKKHGTQVSDGNLTFVVEVEGDLFPAAIRDAMAQVIVDAVTAGAGAGKLEFLGSGDALVASMEMQDPPFEIIEGGTLEAFFPLVSEASPGGSITQYRITDSDGNEVLRGMVTDFGGGGDLEVAATQIPAGSKLRLGYYAYQVQG